MQVRQADAFSIAEGNRWVYRNGEISHTAAVSESQPRYTMISRQLGEPVPSRGKCVPMGMPDARKAKGGRQSDGRIVPEKAGNAAGGKPREGINPQSPAI